MSRATIAGAYFVVITNYAGSITSQVATLTVNPPFTNFPNTPDGYATVNASKYFGVQAGYRSFFMSYVWGSSLNTTSMTIGGPYLGGTVHF